MRKSLLRVVENVAVDADLINGLALGQIEIDRLAAFCMQPSGVEESRGNSKERRRTGTPIDGEGGFVQIQSALPMHEKRESAGLYAIALTALGVVSAESPR